MTPSDPSLTLWCEMTTNNSKTQPKQAYLTIRIEDDLLARLAEAADASERTTAGEARLAIRQHLERVRVHAEADGERATT